MSVHRRSLRRSCDQLRDARLAEQAGDELEGASALEILQWADDHFGDTWCVASSMADAVVPHLASRVRPGVDVVFLDTGYHFAETIGTRDAVAATLPVTVRRSRRGRRVAEQDASFGVRLLRAQPRPVLRAAQGDAAAAGARATTRPGRPGCAATRPRRAATSGWSSGTRAARW